MSAAIEVRNLRHRYRGAGNHPPAIADVSFEVEENDFFTLLGPSGCGKTTTLRCLAGLERPDSGEIRLGSTVVVSGRRFVPTHKRDIGMVFQDYAVWPHMTVFDNVAFPLRMASGRRLRASELRDKVMSMLQLMGMESFAQRRATQLSGGQQQRLSLARALVREPQVLLLDEPLSSLDARLRARMRAELRRLQRQVRVTTVFVTHDQVEALSLSNQIAVMSEGNIVQLGRPRQLYFHPGTEFVANIVGSANLVRGTVASVTRVPDGADPAADEAGLPAVAVIVTPMGPLKTTDSSAAELTVGAECSILIRPEAVQLHHAPPEGGNVYLGRIDLGLFTGESTEHEISIGDIVLNVKEPNLAHVRRDDRFGRGDKVYVEFPPASCVVFAA